jgi:hypothetical protein
MRSGLPRSERGLCLATTETGLREKRRSTRGAGGWLGHVWFRTASLAARMTLVQGADR